MTAFSPAGVLAALAAGVFGAGAGAAQVTCAWGGTPADPQGIFYGGEMDRHGLITPPHEKPTPFSAAAPLTGSDPRCTGVMTIHGEFAPGTTCSAILDHGTISGVPGLAHFDGELVGIGTGAFRATLFAPDGSVAGQYQADVLVPPGNENVTEMCRTQEGYRGDTEWHATVELLP